MAYRSNVQDHQPDMKLKYEEMLKEVSQNKLPKVLMQRQWVTMMIQRIMSAKIILETEDKTKLPTDVKEALENYEIDYTQPEPRLVSMPKRPNESKRIVVALEDSFEVTLKAHLFTHHGGCSDMKNWFTKCKYELSIVCAPVLISVCQKCFLGRDDPEIISIEETLKYTPYKPSLSNNTQHVLSGTLKHRIEPNTPDELTSKNVKYTSKPTDDTTTIIEDTSKRIEDTTKTVDTALRSLQNIYISISIVDVLDMTQRPDKSFQYLLIHQDVKSQFVQLRPMTNDDLVVEISMELTKLFCDFSPPHCIVVHTEFLTAFHVVLEKLNSIFDNKIAVEACESNATEIRLDVETKVTSWISDHACNSWAIGCHFIQWQINNCRVNGMTPYEMLFKSKHDFRDDRNSDWTPNHEDINELEDDSISMGLSMSVCAKTAPDINTIAKPSTHIQVFTPGDWTPNHEDINELENQYIASEVTQTNVTVKDVDISMGLSMSVNAKTEPKINAIVSTQIREFTPGDWAPNHEDINELENQYIDSEETQTNVIVKDVGTSMGLSMSVYAKKAPNAIAKPSTGIQELAPNVLNKCTQINVQKKENGVVKIYPETDDSEIDKQKHICCTCKDLMRTEIYFCCVCRRSLHLYCGARRKENGVMKNVCFTCVNV